jgi:predicted phage terminase large subunit-like protein
MALSTSADIAIIGGAAGGGKTFSLLLEPLRHIKNPNFGSVTFRRVSPQITNEGGLWDKSQMVYPPLGARANQTMLAWDFPSGARVRFAHMQYEKSKEDWQGSEIPLIGFDELTHFTETQFFYMLSRNRSMCGVRPYVRAGTNPNADSWVARLIDWWIDEEGYPDPARAGRIRWFCRVTDGKMEWADTREELERRYKDIPPKSLTFIPAKVDDNQELLRADPGYKANLMALDYIDRMRLLYGNWRIRPAGGKVFNRSWFDVVDVAPAPGVECRFWDFAATKKEFAKDDPDYTAGVRMRQVNGRWYVLDVVAEQAGPAEVERLFVNTSRQDAAQVRETGARYMARWEIEPGSAGKRESQRLSQLLAGIDALGRPSQGDKLARAKPLAAQAEAGNVSLVRGAWNEQWLVHMHGQPDAPHDDIMDASSGAFNELARVAQSRQAQSRQG